MKAILKEAGKPARVIEITGDFKALRKLLHCDRIEALHIAYPLVMLIDELGKLNRKPVNLLFSRDTINGDVLFSANDGAGNLRELKHDEIGKIMLLIAMYEVNTNCALD